MNSSPPLLAPSLLYPLGALLYGLDGIVARLNPLLSEQNLSPALISESCLMLNCLLTLHVGVGAAAALVDWVDWVDWVAAQPVTAEPAFVQVATGYIELSLQVQYGPDPTPVPVMVSVRQEVTGPPLTCVTLGEMVAVGVAVYAHGEEGVSTVG